MKKITKKSLLLALICTLILSCMSIIYVSADETTFGISKAGLRINPDGKNGIVYETQYLRSEFEGLDIKSTGTLFIPEDLLNEGELLLDNELAVKVETTGKWANAGDYVISRAYLHGIPAYSYDRAILARSYVELSDGYVLYSTEKTASFKQVIESAKSAGTLTEEELAIVNNYASEVASAHTLLDLSSEKEISLSTVTFGNAERIDSYKGGVNLLKVVFDENNYYLDNTAWKAEFWKGYYENYSLVTVDFYVENAEYLKELSIVGISQDGTQHKLYLKSEAKSLQDGWHSVVFDVGGVIDNFTCFKNSIRLWGSLLPEYKDGLNTYSSTVYFSSINVTNVASVQNSSSGIIGADGRFVVEDNSLIEFSSCTDVKLHVYAPYGLIEVTDGGFNPEQTGEHLFVYTAKNLNGEPIRAAYTLKLEHAIPGIVNDFAKDTWVPSVNGGHLASIDDKNGVLYLTGKANTDGTPLVKGAFNNGTEFFASKKAEYEKYDTIVFLLKVEKVNPNLEVSLRIDNGFDASPVTNMQIISSIGDAGGNWIEIEYDLATILAKFDEGNLHNNVKLTVSCKVDIDSRYENMAEEDITATIYIDKIYCKNSSEDPVGPEEPSDPDLINDFSNANWSPAVNGGYKAKFQEREGVIYISGLANTDGTSLAKGAFNHGTKFFVHQKNSYQDFNTIVVEYWVEKTNQNLIVSLQLVNGLDAVELAPAKVVSEAGDNGGAWLTIEFDMGRLLEKFDDVYDHMKLSIICEVAEEYRSQDMTTADISAKIYIDKITAKYVEPVILCPGCNSTEEEHGKCEHCDGYLCVGDHTHAPVILCPGCNSTEEEHGKCEHCDGYLCVGDHSTCGATEEPSNEILVNDFANSKWVPLANGGYEENYQGKLGVTYISGLATTEGKPQEKGAFNNGTEFFALAKEAYASATKIVFVIWVQKANVNLEVSMSIVNASDASVLVGQKVVSAIGNAGGEWIEVEFDIAKILEKFDTCHNNIKLVTSCKVDVAHRSENMATEDISARIYIDRVYARGEEAPVILCPGCNSTEEEHGKCEHCDGYLCVGDHSACGAVEEPSNEILVNDFATNAWTPLFNGGYKENYADKNGLLYITGSALASGGPQTKSAFNNGTEFFASAKETYASATKIVFVLYVEKSNVNLEVKMVVSNGADASALTDTKVISAIGDAGGEWIEVEFDIAKILEKFDSCHNNIKIGLDCKVDVNHRSENMATEDITAIVYIDRIYVK